jgi:Trk K+ transport system NAD-binding subunit
VQLIAQNVKEACTICPMASAGPVLLVGGGRLSSSIAERLADAGAQVERLPALDFGEAATKARLAGASALVLAADDDSGNVDLALSARRARTDLPLVVRMFDEALAGYLAATVERLTILSMSQLAAPAFAEATLRSIAAQPEGAVAAIAGRRRGLLGAAPDRILLGALLGLVAIVVPSTVYFARTLDLRPIDALYFVWTTVMTVGYGDFNLAKAPDAAKVVGMLLMLAGAAFVATLFALLTGWVVTARLDLQRGRVRVRGRGHVVIAGAGKLGFRVAGMLAARGMRVVLIERRPDGRNLAALRAAGHHVVVADATDEQILELAGVRSASAVLVLTDSDAVNLRVTLLVRAQRSAATVVVRMYSAELSAHVTQRGDGIALSPVAVAADAFARAALAGGEDEAAVAREAAT